MAGDGRSEVVPTLIMATGINCIDIDVEDTVDVSEYPVDQWNEGEPYIGAYDKTLCQDNKDFANFLNKCLLLEQTLEMEKIIQKVLLPAYVNADDEYKKSENFTRVIKKAIQRLIDEPWKKYSHISDVTDTLKFHVKKLAKKRVNFVTLSTTSVLGKSNEGNRKRVVFGNKSPKKSKKLKLDVVIAVDSEDDDDLIAVDDTGKTTVDDDLITVDNSANKIIDDDLIDAHNIAQKIFVNVFNADGDKVNKMEVDSDLIVVDQKSNEVKVDNSVGTMKPKKNIKSVSKNKIRDLLKLKTSKQKHAITVIPEDESHKNTPDIKLKENCSPNGILVENNNVPIEILDSQEIKIQEETQISNNDTNTTLLNTLNVNSNKLEDNKGTDDKDNLENNENLSESNNKLLVPRMEIAHEENIPNKLNDTEKNERINAIEAKIEIYKKKIADLEVAEVSEDSSVSAYIKCDRLQAHIVKLYKELLSLKDAVPAKGRQVRLRHLAEGLPEGPVRRLENFLNKQVDVDGVAPFPDYADVVRCVEKSNVKDGLGWSKAKVHNEAHALFEYCGRALQKRRQRREWKDLRSQVSREDFDADPAANDPELAAKLELNRQLAQKKEAEILEKFSRMEATSQTVSVQQNEEKTQDVEKPVSPSDKEQEKAESEKSEIPNIKSEMPQETQSNEQTADELVVRVKEEPYEVPVYFNLDASIAIEISDSDSSNDSIYS